MQWFHYVCISESCDQSLNHDTIVIYKSTVIPYLLETCRLMHSETVVSNDRNINSRPLIQ